MPRDSSPAAHLSDIHFGGENPAALAAASAMIVEQPFDLVVVSGDLTRFARHFPTVRILPV